MWSSASTAHRQIGGITRASPAGSMQLLTTIPGDETLDFSIAMRTADDDYDCDDPPPPYVSVRP